MYIYICKLYLIKSVNWLHDDLPSFQNEQHINLVSQYWPAFVHRGFQKVIEWTLGVCMMIG